MIKCILAIDCHMHQIYDYEEIGFYVFLRVNVIRRKIVYRDIEGFVFHSNGFKLGEWILRL